MRLKLADKGSFRAGAIILIVSLVFFFTANYVLSTDHSDRANLMVPLLYGSPIAALIGVYLLIVSLSRKKS